MTALSYALVTPSYWADVERCRMLVESVERWTAPDLKHYLVIARRDVPLFRSMLSARTELVVVEDIVPRWLFRVPGIRHFWLSLKTLPVKNWILQQIVKLSVPSHATEDILLYADSDMFFIAPYEPRKFERDGKVPLFVETGQRGLIPNNDKWQAVASQMLGIPSEESCDTNFINQLICWRRQTVLDMLRRVEDVSGHEWARSVAPLRGFSEYVLYGVYATRILGEASQHWQDPVIRTNNYWGTTPLSLEALREFQRGCAPHHHSAMISAKSNTDIADIRRVFFSS